MGSARAPTSPSSPGRARRRWRRCRRTPRWCSPPTRCPTRILDTGDPYPREVRATASAVAVAAGLGRWSGWSAAWQSAGRTAEPWLGPDILEVIDDLGPAEHVDGLLVCPCGFVADHLEVLYDLDIEARQRAEAAGLVFARTAVVNDDPGVTARWPPSSPKHERARRRRRRRHRRRHRRRTAVGRPRGPARRRRDHRRAARRRRPPGGKLRTTPFAGRPAVDEGADAFLARVPHASDLAARRVWTDAHLPGDRDRLRVARPAPPDPRRAGCSACPPTCCALVHAADCSACAASPAPPLEPLLPRRPATATRSGRWCAAASATRCTSASSTPLVGSIYATDTDRFSLAMVPQLASAGRVAAACCSPPAVRADPRRADRAGVRTRRSAGMQQLAIAAAERAAAAGATVRQRAHGARRSPPTGRGGASTTNRSTPWCSPPPPRPPPRSSPRPPRTSPSASARWTTPTSPSSPSPSTAMAGTACAAHSGYLVPKPDQGLVTAVSFGSQKWAHWRGEGEVLRVSLGRDGRPLGDRDDDALVAAAVDEVGGHLGLDLQPTAVRVTRWPRSFPQYRPDHLGWLAGVDDATPRRAVPHRCQLPRHRRAGVHRRRRAHRRRGARLPRGRGSRSTRPVTARAPAPGYPCAVMRTNPRNVAAALALVVGTCVAGTAVHAAGAHQASAPPSSPPASAVAEPLQDCETAGTLPAEPTTTTTPDPDGHHQPRGHHHDHHAGAAADPGAAAARQRPRAAAVLRAPADPRRSMSTRRSSRASACRRSTTAPATGRHGDAR